jgi:NADPH:quinone reductase-like Zn-dependent oxidoreductase
MVNFPGWGATYAEYVAAPADELAIKPATVSFEEAAAATLAALTAWQAFERGHLKEGNRLLIHGAAGGVGHYAVQIARHLGAYVIATSSESKKGFLESLGVDEYINYQTQRFEDTVRDVDFVLDTVGGDYIDRSLATLKKGGTLVSISPATKDSIAEKAQAKHIHGFFFHVTSNGEDMNHLARLLKEGSMKSFVSRVYEFTQMGLAHLQLESGNTQGKLVIKVDS